MSAALEQSCEKSFIRTSNRQFLITADVSTRFALLNVRKSYINSLFHSDLSVVSVNHMSLALVYGGAGQLGRVIVDTLKSKGPSLSFTYFASFFISVLVVTNSYVIRS